MTVDSGRVWRASHTGLALVFAALSSPRGSPEHFHVLGKDHDDWIVASGRDIAHIDRSIAQTPKHVPAALDDARGDRTLTAVIAAHHQANPVARAKITRTVEYMRRQQRSALLAQCPAGSGIDVNGPSHDGHHHS